ncbi:HDOD domain-containing protein [Calditerrivibrio nitroreducens]|uniref:Response regulator receiver modulated metal dependent hydrolase n=1 Tax=Calditerrivibrio nitroreducens (strain DSM 19672 / NBRC 101217 / Yu37-1) TaxID=768670 RepID=E4TGU7_CALNY|nr:HDOD domain-containing protein [Calditerrivibrio nitroreducens]ADR18707.1 response regulator receiver modulated metal dependent hydrolase [Calditerrivibrio nitroreducens DSM 19672]
MSGVKILLVDDEVSVTKALIRELMMVDAEVVSFNSALDALKYIEKEPVDIIISDVLMPEMDGITFLGIVKEKYPHNIRIILSGHVDINKVMVALYSGVANDYLPKPWDKNKILDKIELYIKLQKSLNNMEIINYIKNMSKLPTLPSIMYEIQMSIQKEVPLNKIAELIEKDPVMTSKLLHVVNSAFYGLKNVNGITQVLSFLGINTVMDIILITSLTGGGITDSYTLDELNNIALRSFRINKAMQRYGIVKKIQEHEIITSSIGVVHDIGKIIILKNDKESYIQIKNTMKNNPGITFYEAELMLKRDGITHQEIGAYFLRMWNFGTKYVDIALNHNNRDIKGDNSEMIKILYNCCRLVDHYINVGEYDKSKIDFLTEDEYNKMKMFVMDE